MGLSNGYSSYGPKHLKAKPFWNTFLSGFKIVFDTVAVFVWISNGQASRLQILCKIWTICCNQPLLEHLKSRRINKEICIWMLRSNSKIRFMVIFCRTYAYIWLVVIRKIRFWRIQRFWKYKYIFVEYDWVKGKYAHTCLIPYIFPQYLQSWPK